MQKMNSILIVIAALSAISNSASAMECIATKGVRFTAGTAFELKQEPTEEGSHGFMPLFIGEDKEAVVRISGSEKYENLKVVIIDKSTGTFATSTGRFDTFSSTTSDGKPSTGLFIAEMLKTKEGSTENFITVVCRK